MKIFLKFLALDIFILMCFLPHFVLCQTNIKVPMVSAYSNTGYTSATIVYDKNNLCYDSSRIYKGIPDNIDSYIIKIVDFQPAQALFELYNRLKGQMSTKELSIGFKYYGFTLRDTTELINHPIKHFVSFLVGKDHNHKKVIIGDENNNYDFSDDDVFYFDDLTTNVSNDDSSYGIGNFYYEFAYNGKIIGKTLFLKMLSSDQHISYKDTVSKENFLSIKFIEYKKGILGLFGDSLAIKAVADFTKEPFYQDINTKIYIGAETGNSLYYLTGDTFYIKNKKFIINNICYTGDTLFLSYAGDAKLIYGNSLNEYAYNIISKDILSGQSFNLYELRGNYILLDFWGSWCKPCIESIPGLKRYSQLYGKKLQLVSIAEENGDYKAVEKIIKNKKMDWTHLFEQINDTSQKSIAYKYKVESFPTQLLINPDGKIIYRSSSGDKLNEKKLISLIN